MHYVMTQWQPGHVPAPSKRPFTITNDQVPATVVDKMLQKICTGILTAGFPVDRRRIPVEAIFYRTPDGAPWVKWTSYQGIAIQAPVTELGASAHWKGIPASQAAMTRPDPPRFAVWPVGDN